MMTIDLQKTRSALARLDQVMIENPDLAGYSTEDKWADTLEEVLMEDDKQVYTVSEAAAFFSCHPETIKRAIRSGKLSAANIGRDYRLSRTELVKYWTDSGGGELFPARQKSAPGQAPADTE
jgi:excisionase family DNA binding protein